MNQKNSAHLFGIVKSDQVDPVNGIIKGVVIIQSGKDKHGDNYDMKSLEQLVSLGNAQNQGVKVRNGHPNLCESKLGSFIGRYKNFRIQLPNEGFMGDPAGQKSVVLADLYLDKEACKTSPAGDPFEHIMLMAQKNSDMFGNSICFMPDECEVVTEKDAQGNDKKTVYTRFKSFIASDLVDSPAATTSLFKDHNDFAAKATLFLDENPEMFELLEGHPEILEEFKSKYKAFKSAKEKSNTITMATFKEKVKALLGLVVKDFTAQTADGKTISITDASGSGVPAAGEVVSDESGNPIPSATLPMSDGSTIMTDADGKITTITQAEAKPTPPVTPEKSADEKLVEMKAQYDALVKEKAENEEASLKAIETLTTKVTDLEGRLSKIKSTGDPKTSGTQFPKGPGAEKKNSKEGKTPEERQKEIKEASGL